MMNAIFISFYKKHEQQVQQQEKLMINSLLLLWFNVNAAGCQYRYAFDPSYGCEQNIVYLNFLTVLKNLFIHWSRLPVEEYCHVVCLKNVE